MSSVHLAPSSHVGRNVEFLDVKFETRCAALHPSSQKDID